MKSPSTIKNKCKKYNFQMPPESNKPGCLSNLLRDGVRKHRLHYRESVLQSAGASHLRLSWPSYRGLHLKV